MKKIMKAGFVFLWITLLLNVSAVRVPAAEAEGAEVVSEDAAAEAGPDNIILETYASDEAEIPVPEEGTTPEIPVQKEGSEPEIPVPDLEAARADTESPDMETVSAETVPEEVEPEMLTPDPEAAGADMLTQDSSGGSGLVEPYPGAPYKLKYHVEKSGTVCIDGFEGTGIGSLVIPSAISGKPVTRIAADAFKNSGFTGSLTIPDSVVNIGANAFQGCEGFGGSLTLGSGLVTIGDRAFKGCKHLGGDLIIPDSVITIGEGAFQGNEGAGSLIIGSGVVTIGDSAFQDCKNLSGSLTIPDSVVVIGSGAFASCIGFNKSLTIPDSVAVIGNDAFYGCGHLCEEGGTLTIGSGVKSIGPYAFYCCQHLKHLEFPESGSALKSIGEYAFEQCVSLQNTLNIPDSVEIIDSYAFHSCIMIAGLQFGEQSRLKTIGKGAFESCEKIKSIKIPKSVETIGKYAFKHSDSEFYPCEGDLIIPDSVRSIESGAFENCHFTGGSLTIGSGIETITKNMFSGCTFDNDLTIKGGLTSIEAGAFEGCGFNGSLTIGDRVKSIEAGAFEGCGFKGNLTIGNGLKTVNGGIFTGLPFKGTLTLGKNIRTIGQEAFKGCTFTGGLTIPDSVTEIGEGAFEGNEDRSIIEFGNGNLTLGKNIKTISNKAFYQCDFKGGLAIPDSVTVIGDKAFDSCEKFDGTLTIGKKVKTIGTQAFHRCGDFRGSLIIPDSVKTIGSGAFWQCEDFNGTLTLGKRVETIGDMAFWSCENITGDLIIPDSVKTIGHFAFMACTGFNGNLKIGKGVQKIGNGAFSGCRNFTGSLSIPTSVATIGHFAFGGCESFAGDLIIPDSVKDLGVGAFSGCTGLDGNLTIGAGVKEIKNGYKLDTTGDSLEEIIGAEEDLENGIFFDCGFKGRLTIPKSVKKIEDKAFYGCNSLSIVINRSSQEVNLPEEEGKHWVNNKTGETITKIKTGTAHTVNDTEGDAYTAVAGRTFTHNYIPPQTYTGGKIKPELTVYYGETLLKEKTDYTVIFSKNVNVGTAKLTITGKGNYSGKETDIFSIVPRDIGSFEEPAVSVSEIASVSKSKKGYTPVPAVTYNSKKLKKGKDFTVKYYTDAECTVSVKTPKNPGTYYAKLTGQGNFTGSVKRAFVIADSAQIPVSELTITVKDKQYEGGNPVELNADELTVTIKKNGETIALTRGDDYYVRDYRNNIEIGTASFIIEGNPEKGYVGRRTVPFKITGVPMEKVTIVNFKESISYDGKQLQNINLIYMPEGGDPVPIHSKLKEEYEKLTNSDEKRAIGCLVSYKNNKNAGTATMILEGVNGYTGRVTKTFKIERFNLLEDTENKFAVVLDNTDCPYAKSSARPKPFVRFYGELLTEGRDYTLSYENNTSIRDKDDKEPPTVIVKGKGNFSGAKSATFTINQADMAATGLQVVVNDVVYKNKNGNWKPKKITVKDADGKTLKEGTDYTIAGYSYRDKPDEVIGKDTVVPAGNVIQVTVCAESGSPYTGSITGSYRIAKQDISKLSATVKKKTYTGKAVTLSEGDISWKKKGVTFEIDEGSYRKNVEAGTASVTVTGTGNYCGRKTLTFKIAKKGFRWWWT